MNSQVRRLLDLTEDLRLFRAPDGKLYATATVGNHSETWELRSPQATQLLQHRYYSRIKEAPASQCVQEAIRNLQAKAQFDGAMYPVSLRVAEYCGRIYLDLANDNWEVVEIDCDGWRMVPNPPVKFRRARGMQPLPPPVRGGSVDEFRALTNLGNNSEWVLVEGSLLGALRPSGPYPILVVHGEQGSSKTTLMRMLRALVDPSSPDLRAEPQNEHDLIIAASNNWVLSFDNLSRISPWLSDALCRLATGAGHATRQLRSDFEEALFDVQRPVMLNGIAELATRSDLLSRCVVIELPPIASSQRRPEGELWQEFDAAHPRILGALLDAVATGLRRIPTTKLPYLPRMADFAVWVSAAEPSLGWDQGRFLRAYDQNQASANELALEASPITAPLFALLRTRCFEGTADNLLASLAKHTDEASVKRRGWPRTPRHLRQILNRLAPNLRAAGVELMFSKARDRKRTRLITIQLSASEPSAPSEETPTTATGYPCDPVELSVDNARTEALDEVSDLIRDTIIPQALHAGDHRSAVAAIRESIRIEELKLKWKGGGDLEDYRARMEAFCPPGIPLPGQPGGPPLTDEGKQALEEVGKLSPADRELMREGLTAATRMSDLLKAKPAPAEREPKPGS